MLVFALVFTQTSLSASGPEAFVRNVFVAGEADYAGFRIPALLVTQTGRVLAFAEGRRRGLSDTGDIDLVLKTSDDGGHTWSDLRVLWDRGHNTVGNPAPVLDCTTGVIWLLVTANRGKDTEREIMRGHGSRTVWVFSSSDDGETWTKPKEITHQVKRPEWAWYATGPGAGIQLRSGRLVVPCDHSLLPTDARLGPFLYHSHVVYSDDHGLSWAIGGSPDSLTNECTCAELSDGSLYLNMRSYYGLHRRAVSRSTDGGLSWTPVQHDTTLVEPVCQASVVRYPYGRAPGDTLLFANPASTERRNLTVRLSPDGGRTWTAARVLHPGPAAYSSLAVSPSGRILCLYECGDEGPYERIVLSSFTLDWLVGEK